jgi:hypothetical protein
VAGLGQAQLGAAGADADLLRGHGWKATSGTSSTPRLLQDATYTGNG